MDRNRRITYLIGFLFAINLALTSYVNSSFLSSFINEDYVGFIYAFASLIAITGFFNMAKILKKIGNRKMGLYFSITSLVSLMCLAFFTNKFLIILSFVIYFVSSNMLVANLDIFIEEFSVGKHIGKFRGLFLTIINLGWVLAQTVSGSVIAKSSYQGIYLLSALFLALVSGLFITYLGDFIDPIYKKISIRKTFSFFKKEKNILRIYLINLILKFFYAWMVIYTPIYLHEHLNISWDHIGIIFMIMLLPFVILDIPLGNISDKIGEKKLLILGFIISAFFVAIMPIIGIGHIAIWAIILFGTRVGAATIELMSEAYFFKLVSFEKADIIGFFRNTTPLSYILAPLIAIPVLLYIPSFKFIFFILSAILLLGLLITLKLKDVK